jgi:hypothetical protein
MNLPHEAVETELATASARARWRRRIISVPFLLEMQGNGAVVVPRPATTPWLPAVEPIS